MGLQSALSEATEYDVYVNKGDPLYLLSGLLSDYYGPD